MFYLNKMIGEMCKSPHLNEMINLKNTINCNVYAEIGVLYGGSLIEQMKDDKECYFIGIDPFTGYYGSSYDPHRQVDLTEHIDIVKQNLSSNNPHNHEWELIKNKSNDAVKDVERLLELNNQKIDFLFIDGDHSYQGVIDDFYNYKDLISDHGVLVFDNYKDPNWREVETAVKYIIDNNDYMIQSEFGHCCVLHKKKT
tara:strand:+ start:61 stop:654 length:594 start_codon:yes stop_codon:yes gene_type:complete